MAEAGEDYLYTSSLEKCTYVRDGEPSCLIGRVLAKHGVPLEVLTEWDECESSGIAVISPNFIEDRALIILTEVQKRQDQGSTWGAALKAGKLFVSMHGWDA